MVLARAPDDPKLANDPVLHSVLEDAGRSREAVLARDRLFPLLEDRDPKRRLIAYFSSGTGGIDLTDAAPIGSMLDAIGRCQNLDLMINSPGGYGESAEKLVEMCREHCQREFRVIVPNYAKSAATLITLGANVIVMGYLSELGPIDPQIVLNIAGVRQAVSAQSVIQAYDRLHKRIKESVDAGESPVALLQSLSTSTMEPAFVEECRRGVEFSRDLAEKFLPRHQLKAKYKNRRGYGASRLRALASEAADNLLSKEARFSHGRLIGAEEARDEVGLNVELLDRDDAVWRAYWELYVRAEIYMQTIEPADNRTVSKLFLDRDSTLPVFSPG